MAAPTEGVTAQHLQSHGDLLAKEEPGDSISCLAWSPTQDVVAAGCWDRNIYLWEVAPWPLLRHGSYFQDYGQWGHIEDGCGIL